MMKSREAKRAADRAYAATHRAEACARVKAWNIANPGRSDARVAAWILAHPDRRRAIARAYVNTHPAKLNANTAKRRALKLQATPSWANHAAIRAVYAEAARLTRETGTTHHVDHYYPLVSPIVCGLHVEQNLQILTKVQNHRKSNHHPDRMVA